MAAYNAFQCDSCGKVMSRDERTRVTTRFEGPVVSGEMAMDKCTECLNPPSQEDLKPLRRRKRTRAAESGALDATG